MNRNDGPDAASDTWRAAYRWCLILWIFGVFILYLMQFGDIARALLAQTVGR
jgi:hypothetical protein